MPTNFTSLSVAIIGGGPGGVSAAIALRRAGHRVTIYERNDFAGEVGAGVGIPSNGTKWLEKWGVDIEAGKPVVMDKLIIHKWDTGKVLAIAPLGNYKEKFGYDTLGFQRCDLHRILLDTALSQDGAGTPVKLVTSHLSVGVDTDLGRVIFDNGEAITADLVVAADGIHSRLRSAIGITPDVKQASSCAYRHIISTRKARELGIEDIGSKEALEFWMGPGTNKIAIGSAHGGEVIGIYSFFP
jgi:salicylate hydroxylase